MGQGEGASSGAADCCSAGIRSVPAGFGFLERAGCVPFIDGTGAPREIRTIE